MTDLRPIGTYALSDAEYVTPANPFGWAAPVLNWGATLSVAQVAKIAAGYGCQTLYLWDSFGGSADHEKAGYVSDVLDAVNGLVVVNECSQAIAAAGVRPGIIIRPQQVVRGVNGTKIDGSNPVGQLLWQAKNARSCGFMDFYVDSLCDECNQVLPADRFRQVTDAFPDATFLVEFWADGYEKLGNVIHWRKGAATFTNDRPQAVGLTADDVKAPAQRAAWGKRLRDTRSTVIVNCRPDDPTLPERQAPVLAAWRASQGK